MAKNAEEILRAVALQLLTEGCNSPTMNAKEREQLATKAIETLKQRIAHECGQIDGKFCGLVWRRRDGRVEEQFVVFVPRDRFLPAALFDYGNKCLIGGAEKEQVEAVGRLLTRVEQWQRENRGLVKTPDAAPGECL